MNPFEYDCAIVCNNVPKSAVNGLSLDKHEPVDVEKASLQHQNYINALKKTVLETIELEADENYPDCVFVEVSNYLNFKFEFILNLSFFEIFIGCCYSFKQSHINYKSRSNY
jgi:hypothetical protein